MGIGAWVRNPGSLSPPPIIPVLSVGGVFDVPVQFCCGTEIANAGAQDMFLGIKPADSPAGDYIASNNSPIQTSSGLYVFSVDLTTTDAKAYFTANPTELTQDAAMQIAFTQDGVERRTVPLGIVIQNDYLQDQ